MSAINICVPTDLDPCASYGHLALELGRHLQRMGVQVNLHTLGKRHVAGQDEELRRLVDQPIEGAAGGIFFGYPTAYHAYAKGPPWLAYTMFESTKLPGPWVPILNRCAAVVVPSAFCATVFRHSGVQTPVHVVAPGISEAYAVRKRAQQPDPLTFLAFIRGGRKGAVTAIQAFVRAFGDDPKFKLILKGRQDDAPFVMTNPNIEVVQADLDEAALFELFYSCDVLVNAHRGEGFGLIPRQFAASGGLALTTAWSGTAENLDLWGEGLPYKLVKADWVGHPALEGQDLGEWAEVDTDALADKLREVAANWPHYQAGLAAKATAIAWLYSWQDFAEELNGLWQWVQKRERVLVA